MCIPTNKGARSIYLLIDFIDTTRIIYYLALLFLLIRRSMFYCKPSHPSIL
ncbi:MAG: hypothetical protein BAJALOKI2v1_590024 [Promethearchaeota archaeon]|nr:MAG: hypothetical protein BAJALOKI2v1_590024 [Candidatus Lokiarchaeota archaeon]